jgi:hypothetical protein
MLPDGFQQLRSRRAFEHVTGSPGGEALKIFSVSS